MSKKQYLRISLLDVIRCYGEAKNNNENQEVVNKLADLFVSSDSTEVSILEDSEEAKCLLKYNKVIMYQNYITLESLAIAFNRLYFGKNNKDLLDKIKKYYQQFYELVKRDEDRSSLKQEIILDKEVFEYIRQFLTYEDYEKQIVGKNLKDKINIKEKNSEIRGKAIIN